MDPTTTSPNNPQWHWYQTWRIKYCGYKPITEASAVDKGMDHFIHALAAIPGAYALVIAERETNYICWVKKVVPNIPVSDDDKIAAELVLQELLKKVDGGDGVPYSAEAFSDGQRLCLIARVTLNYRDKKDVLVDDVK